MRGSKKLTFLRYNKRVWSFIIIAGTIQKYDYVAATNTFIHV